MLILVFFSCLIFFLLPFCYCVTFLLGTFFIEFYSFYFLPCFAGHPIILASTIHSNQQNILCFVNVTIFPDIYLFMTFYRFFRLLLFVQFSFSFNKFFNKISAYSICFSLLFLLIYCESEFKR